MKATQEYIDANKKKFLDELLNLLKMPSVSADPKFAGSVRETAEFIADKLKEVQCDNVEICGYNSRLDTLQAVVGNWLIPSAKKIADQRIKNASFYDKNLSKIKGISIPPRIKNYKIVYHLYIVFAERRDELLKYCQKMGIEAKIHYPVPMYRQTAMKFLKHKKGDFPVSDRHAKSIISFPCDQHLSQKEMNYVIKCVKDFYS